MAINKKISFFHGPTEKIQANIEKGKVNENDFVVSSDENVLYYVDASKNAIPLGYDGRTKSEIEVNLGDDGFIGGIENGDTFKTGLSFEQFLEKLVKRAVHPEYKKPELVAEITSDDKPGRYEVGTVLSPTIEATFTRNEAGNLVSLDVLKNGDKLYESSEDTIEQHIPEFRLEEETSFNAQASYEESDLKLNNLGEEDGTNKIEAGQIVSKSLVYTPIKAMFYGGGIDDPPEEITSAFVRGLPSGPDIEDKDVVQVKMEPGQKWVMLCVPRSVTIANAVYLEAGESEILDCFNKTTAMVEGVDGYTASEYDVYCLQVACPTTTGMTFEFTLEGR